MSLLLLFNQGGYNGPWTAPRGTTVVAGSREKANAKVTDGLTHTVYAKADVVTLDKNDQVKFK